MACWKRDPKEGLRCGLWSPTKGGSEGHSDSLVRVAGLGGHPKMQPHVSNGETLEGKRSRLWSSKSLEGNSNPEKENTPNPNLPPAYKDFGMPGDVLFGVIMLDFERIIQLPAGAKIYRFKTWILLCSVSCEPCSNQIPVGFFPRFFLKKTSHFPVSLLQGAP